MLNLLKHTCTKASYKMYIFNNRLSQYYILQKVEIQLKYLHN